MATENQVHRIQESLKSYKKRYIKKQFNELDESATRIMINSFLTEVLNYVELDEIKTEFNIKGEYADYVIQLKRKKQFVIEVKSIQLDLNERHLRQSLSYAANEGIDWIILTNGRTFQFYRVMFEKPIRTELLFTVDFTLATSKDIKSYAEILAPFTKRGVEKNEHEVFWKRSVALSPDNVSKILYSEDVVKLIRREIKNNTGIGFEPETIKLALKSCLAKPMNMETMKYKNSRQPKSPAIEPVI